MLNIIIKCSCIVHNWTFRGKRTSVSLSITLTIIHSFSNRLLFAGPNLVHHCIRQKTYQAHFEHQSTGSWTRQCYKCNWQDFLNINLHIAHSLCDNTHGKYIYSKVFPCHHKPLQFRSIVRGTLALQQRSQCRRLAPAGQKTVSISLVATFRCSLVVSKVPLWAQLSYPLSNWQNDGVSKLADHIAASESDSLFLKSQRSEKYLRYISIAFKTYCHVVMKSFTCTHSNCLEYSRGCHWTLLPGGERTQVTKIRKVSAVHLYCLQDILSRCDEVIYLHTFQLSGIFQRMSLNTSSWWWENTSFRVLILALDDRFCAGGDTNI